MAYVVKVSHALDGIRISKKTFHTGDEFVVTTAPDKPESCISIGDSVHSINGQSFVDIASRCAFKDPTSILCHTKLPLTLTLMKRPNQMRPRQTVLDPNDVDSIVECKEQPNEQPKEKPARTVPLYSDPDTDTDCDSEIHSISMTVKMDDSVSSICPSLRASALVHSPISYSRSTRPSLKSRCSVISEYAESTQSEREESNIGSIGLSNQLIGRHFVQKDSLNLSVHFDTAALTQSNGKIIAVSSHPLKSGTHEWTVEIMECDVGVFLCSEDVLFGLM